ncbi:Peptidylprolyl isomerase [Alteripontixanthobacter maritimus]|uniref:Peptidyl-prolyl cis-trans isomerase n=1 Tax=Alteripontixanthobacter maritimus TaxID=2161824 RepID=A0A369Q8M7_9SPHN|nr:FKBP-type peptidyl-prolyl cis-trans isomerase [Alteripontixanthobacter maritimus]RDC61241.1 Peptidylprolyl isomerase [Alteripontixanthobacter maritimus]
MSRRSVTLFAAAAMLASASGVTAQDRSADATNHAQDAAWHNRQQAAIATLSAEDGWGYIDGGLMWRRVAGDGIGPRPTVADTVKVHYAGTFVDGETFDSSYDRGEPVEFPLGRLISAWQLAIPKMAVGDTIEIASPASLAYGVTGNPRIPGGATLMFKVELLGIAEQ